MSGSNFMEGGGGGKHPPVLYRKQKGQLCFQGLMSNKKVAIALILEN